MPADNVEFSGDRRFRLYHWGDDRGDHTRWSIRLEHAPTGAIVLDLTDDAAYLESYRFSDAGKLLHLILTRAARDVVRYPATIDLETGLYYHHPQPREAHGPAGRAEDLETLARTGRVPEFDPAALVRWPASDKLDSSAEPGAAVRNPSTPPVPEATQQKIPKASAAAEPEDKPPLKLSSDGQWQIDVDFYELVPLGWIERTSLVHVPTGKAVLDLTGTYWDCEATFVPHCNQVRLTVRPLVGAPRLTVKIDLDCLLYWEESGEDLGTLRWEESGEIERVAGGVQAAPLAELQQRLTAEPDVVRPAERSRATGPMWPRWAFGGAAPAAGATPQPMEARKTGRPVCSLACMAFMSSEDGRKLVHAAVRTGDTGEPVLSTLGTRWDLHGHEVDTTDLILHLHHADDPLLHKTVLVWPIGEASFGDLEGATSGRNIQAEIVRLDTEARTRPRGVAPARDYVPPPPHEIAEPKSSGRHFRGEVEHDNTARPKHLPASEYVIETCAIEIAPHRYEDELRLKHPHVARPALDLFESGWCGSAECGGHEWRFDLWYPPIESRRLTLTVKPGPGTARVNRVAGTLPLRFVEMHLAAFRLHDDFEAMLRALGAGPTAPDQPALTIPIGTVDRVPRLEFWRAPEPRSPLFQPRLVTAAGRAELDLRGTAWTISIHAWPGSAGMGVPREGFSFRLARFGTSTPIEDYTGVYTFHPDSMRITRNGSEGSTALAVMHGVAHSARTAAAVDQRLGQAIALGRGLPVP